MKSKGKLIFAGAALGIAAMSLLGCKSKVVNTDYNTVQKRLDDSISALVVDVKEIRVKLLPSQDSSVHLQYPENEDLQWNISLKNGVLTIQENRKSTWFSWTVIDDDDKASLRIALPESACPALTVNAGSADVTVDGRLQFADVELNTSSGDAEFEAKAQSLHMSASSGDLDLRNTEIGALTMHTSSGEVKVENVTCTSAQAHTSSGEIELHGVTASGELEMKTSSADIELERCDAASLTLKTSSGDIEAELLTPKTIQTHTSSGSVRVPPTSSQSGGSCTANTSSGSIKITFAP